MTAAIAFALFATLQAGGRASFADVWERWNKVDVAWQMPASKSRHAAAVPHLKGAASMMFAARWGQACQGLDAALSALEGRKGGPEQAVTLHFYPSVVQPGHAAQLFVSWAYMPDDRRPLRLKIGDRDVMLSPGRPLTIDVNPGRTTPELTLSPELGVPMVAEVGESSRVVPLTILKSSISRIDALMKGSSEFVCNLGQECKRLLEDPYPLNPLKFGSLLGLGESLDAGRERLINLDFIPFAKQGPTALHVALPQRPVQAGGLTWVVGMSGFGGESAFFEGLGRGAGSAQALKRGWAFVGASSTDTAVGDALTWIRTNLKLPIARYFVIGYGRAAGQALAAMALKNRPAAMAVLAPASTAFPQEWTAGPVLFAVGKGDAFRVVSSVESIVRQLGDRKDVKLVELEDCEHLMLPAEAMAQAFEFFDAYAKRSETVSVASFAFTVGRSTGR